MTVLSQLQPLVFIPQRSSFSGADGSQHVPPVGCSGKKEGFTEGSGGSRAWPAVALPPAHCLPAAIHLPHPWAVRIGAPAAMRAFDQEPIAIGIALERVGADAEGTGGLAGGKPEFLMVADHRSAAACIRTTTYVVTPKSGSGPAGLVRLPRPRSSRRPRRWFPRRSNSRSAGSGSGGCAPSGWRSAWGRALADGPAGRSHGGGHRA